MSGSHVQGSTKLPNAKEMTHKNTASPAMPAAASASPPPSSLPASPAFAQREEVPASAGPLEGSGEHASTLRIRVWYLDDVFTRAAPKFVPDVATLKQLLPEREVTFPTAASPTTTTVGDHFAEIPYDPPSLPATTSNARLDTMNSASDRASFPSISLRPASPTHPGGHPAWVSVKAASPDELAEILDWLPIHVLTRRRILNILCKPAADADSNATGAARASTTIGSDSDDEDEVEEGGDAATTDAQRRHSVARDNFLEYFPAHGYAVLCLQAVPLPQGESTRRGATPKEELRTHGTQIPNTPVVALAFESTLFTFTLSRFGGEGDVRLIVANHVASPTSRSARGGMPARVTTITTLSSTTALSEKERSWRATAAAAPETTDSTAEASAMAFENSTTPPLTGKDVEDGLRDSPRATGNNNRAATATSREGHAAPPPLLVYPPTPTAASTTTTADAAAASHVLGSPTSMGSPNWNAATAISVVCSSLISAIIAYLQQSTRALLMEADQLDELVLQILPSRVDQDDMLVRTKSIRNFIAAFHIDALQKERVLKQLLLPAMRQTPLAQSTQAIERYQRSLSSVRSTVIKLRKGRDIVNMASMTLISGVSARLLTHCNFMDYLNHVQTQIAVVVMPITVIPGIFAINVKVPWGDSQSMTPFYCLLSITLALMILGVSYPLYNFYMYRAPKALAPLE